MNNITSCPICIGSKLTEISKVKDYLVTNETFALLHCPDCDFLITSPRPDNNHLTKYYQSTDYISHTNSGTNLINWCYLLARNFTLKHKLNLLNKYSTKGKVLDIGCGTGHFLNTCKKNGWLVEGIEQSAEAKRIASQTTPNIKSSLEEIRDEDKYDAITLWHVLEHLPDLKITIEKLRQILKPHGAILIAVPNFNSYDSKFYNAEWAGLDVPRHLWHFSQKAITRLFEQYNFKLKATKPLILDSYYVSLLSEKYINNNQISLRVIGRGFYRGLLSNRYAKRNNNDYSSLIYIITK